MTRADFVTRAIREAELRLGLPRGWWGTFNDVHGPQGENVKYKAHGGYWAVILNGEVVSRHDSRDYAIKKANSRKGRR